MIADHAKSLIVYFMLAMRKVAKVEGREGDYGPLGEGLSKERGKAG